jgi:hypothetical protein
VNAPVLQISIEAKTNERDDKTIFFVTLDKLTVLIYGQRIRTKIN